MLKYITDFLNTCIKPVLIFAFFICQQPLFAQTVECNENVTLNILGDCEYPLNYHLFLESTDVPEDSFFVEVLGGNSFSVNQVTYEHIGENLIFHVVHEPSGNYCWGTLEVLNTVAPALICPEITVHCHEFSQTTPSYTGEPTLVDACYPDSAYTYMYSDDIDNLDCPDDYAFSINRTWTVTDLDGLASTCIQQINGEFLSFSEVTFPDNFDGNVRPAFECNDSMSLAMQIDTSITGVPTAYGRRLENFYCELSATFSDIVVPGCGGSREIKRNWTLIDFCTNTSFTHQQVIQFNDTEGPQFSIPDTLRASISGNCSINFNLPPAIVQFECSNYDVEIVTPWETFNSNGGIFAIPPVVSNYLITYNLTDDCGNLASKTVVLKVRETEFLHCPTDTTITCKRYFQFYETPLNNGDFAVLGNLGQPQTDENCYFDFQNSALLNVNDCGTGTITRLMTSNDGVEPISCLQTITVEHLSDFAVEFPEDIELTCDMGPDSYGQPIIYGDNCENIEIVYEDQIFDTLPDACYQIVRTWKVYNRCVIDADTTNFVNETSEVDLMISDCDLNEDSNCNNRTFQDGLNIDNYPNPDPDGVIVYQQNILVQDDTAPVFVNGCEIPEVCITNNTCFAEIILPTPELSECDYRDTWQVSSSIGEGFGPFSNIPIGTISVNYMVFDPCGHATSCQTILTVSDCQAPTAVCHNSLLVELNEGNNCETTLNASDVSNGTADNCSGGLTYSFSADSLVAQMVISEGDEAAIPVEIFVTDPSGNQGSCTSTIAVESDNSCIPPTGQTISGFILRPNGDGISEVDVDISVNNITIANTTTEVDGLYAANVLFMGDDYQITPTKEGIVGNGITTFDLVILRKHILGDEIITDPYRLIAADVNNSNSVTTLDLVNIRKVILNISQSFPGPSWRFIPADYVFPNPSTPWNPPYPEFIDLNTVPPVYDADFIGVRIGDLN